MQITEEASSEYKQTDTEMSAVPAPAPANENVMVVILKSIVQGGLMGTKQNLKTGREKYNYISRVTGSWRLTTGSQQS